MKMMNWKLIAACLAAAPWVHSAEARLDVSRRDESDSVVLETVLDAADAADAHDNSIETRMEQRIDAAFADADVKEIQKIVTLIDSGDGSDTPVQLEIQPLKGEGGLVKSDVRLDLKSDAPELNEPKDDEEDSDVRPSPDQRHRTKNERHEGKAEADEAKARQIEARAERQKARAEREKARAGAQAEKARAKQLARSLSAIKRQGGGYLGVGTSEASTALRMQLKLPEGVGLVVDQVIPGGPAEQAGLEQYDVLQKLNEQLLVNPQQFSALVRGRKPGDSVTIELVREGQPIKVKATLAALPNHPADVVMPPSPLPIPPQNWAYVAPPMPQVQPFGGATPPPPPPAPIPPVAVPAPVPDVKPLPFSMHGRQPGPSFGFQMTPPPPFPPSPGAKPQPESKGNGTSNVTVDADGETIRVTRNGKTWLVRITDDNGIQISEASSKDEAGASKLDKIKRLIVREAREKDASTKKPKSN